MKILVPCEQLSLRGGILRFDRMAREIAKGGHQLAFLQLGKNHENPLGFFADEVTLETAASQEWGAVMIPGAGFSTEVIGILEKFRAENFGLRVQHILNDQTHYSRFEAVNNAIKPDLVVFNNTHWEIGSYTKLFAKQFHVLEGAVDGFYFGQGVSRDRKQSERQQIVVGGLANKNPKPLVQALRLLPDAVHMHLVGYEHIGVDRVKLENTDLIDSGRLKFLGLKQGAELREYYAGVDIIVATEIFAGWCNLGAEAMASSVPLICTDSGTLAYAENEVTALVIDSPPTAATISSAVQRLIEEPGFAQTLAAAGRTRIQDYGWADYAQKMLSLLESSPQHHYYRAEEIGLYGKWGLEDRFEGLDTLFHMCDGKSIIDLGAAEGLVGLSCMKNGAKSLLGFEIDDDRVVTANDLLRQQGFESRGVFHAADLSNWQSFLDDRKELIEEQYDMVLYLGIHQHLGSKEARMGALKGALCLVRELIAIRMPKKFYVADQIDRVVQDAGFELIDQSNREGEADYLGNTRLYKRN